LLHRVMIEAMLFDVDGTLIDSNYSHVLAWRDAFKSIDKDVSPEQIFPQMGKGGDQLLPVFLSAEEIERHGKRLREVHSEIYLERYLPQVKPFPRVRELFERLRADGIRIVLASSAKKSELEGPLGELRIDDLIEATTSADEVDHSKPCPDVFAAALQKLGNVQPADALVVGDTPYDAQAAAKVCLQTIAFLSGGFREADLRSAPGVIAVYRDPADLLQRYNESPLAQRARKVA
jgi:HAD superfamily hydrolase (TIGR01549 family)